jgi:Retrotransposon gag protein
MAEEAWTAMQTRITTLEQKIESLVQLLEIQQQQSHQQISEEGQNFSPVPQSTPRLPKQSIKFNKPPEYDGKDKHYCTSFLSQVELYIRANRSEFANDESKILFTITYLRGPAYTWIEPHIEKENDPIMATWSSFKQSMIKSLGDPDRERTITRQIQNLRQTKSCASYATEFFKFSAFLTWNDDALRAQFYTGLKSEVKDALAIMDRTFTSIDELSDVAIRLDNRLFERRSEERKTSTTV